MPPVQPAAGLVIAGKYRLLERIGVGGMSEVYRADNTLIGRTVALKLLHPDQAADRGLAARFFQEAQSLSKIRHPGIVDVLDAGEGETGPFIVMEYLQGESAARLLARRGKLGIPVAVATLLPVLSALQTAHDVGIIHRDLKPENVFYAIEDAGTVRVKLLDFGIAKLLWPSGPTPRTSTGIVFGTPDYLSPEQASGEVNVDARSDVFSAGVLLFELLTNVRPFHAPTAVATAYKVAHARTPCLADHGGPADATLQAILARALQKRPEERYQSVREFAAELAAFAAPTHELERALLPVLQLARSAAGQASSAGDASVGGRHDARVSVRTPEPHSSGRLRSLPARFAGQCHARGMVLRAVDEHVKATAGADARTALLRELGEGAAQDLLDGTTQGIVHYDLAMVTSYLDLATQRLYEKNPAWCKIAGASSVDGELSALLRTALRPDTPLLVLRRVVPLLSRLFDFGMWEVRPDGAQRVSVRVTDFEPASLTVRLWLAGVLEGALRVCDTRPHLTIARGDAGFSPQVVFDISTL
jgi:serine/threonine protein kinase